MTATDPHRLKLSDRLAAAVEWTPGMERVPYRGGPDLPGTVRPNSYAALAISDDRDHFAVGTLVYTDADLKERLAEVVTLFRDGVQALGLTPHNFAPMPHMPAYAPVYYVPVMVDGIPARCIMSYSAMDQAYRLTLDAHAAYRDHP